MDIANFLGILKILRSFSAPAETPAKRSSPPGITIISGQIAQSLNRSPTWRKPSEKTW
jgi:hypothetical protein